MASVAHDHPKMRKMPPAQCVPTTKSVQQTSPILTSPAVDEGYSSYESPSPLATRAAASTDASCDPECDNPQSPCTPEDSGRSPDSACRTAACADGPLIATLHDTLNQACEHPAQPPEPAAAVPATKRSVASNLFPEILQMVLSLVRSTTTSPREAQTSLAAAVLVNRHWHRYGSLVLWEQPFLASESAVSILAARVAASADACDTEVKNVPPRSLGSHIRRLDMGRVRLKEPDHSTILNILSEQCSSLRFLRMQCEGIDFFSLQRLVTASPHLEALVLSGHLRNSFDVCESSLVGFTRTVSRLKVIHIDVGFDGDTARNRLANLVASHVGPSLRHLRLAGADDDTRVASICAKCPNIEVLMYGWSNITVSGIAAIAASAHNLRVLDLRGCQKAVTPASIASLLCACQNLEAIDLGFASGSDEVLETITNYATNIHTAILSGFVCAESTLIGFIKKTAERLRVLSVAWIGGVMTDRTVLAISRHCPNMQKLDVRGCRLVTESALSMLIATCSHLRVLKIEGPGGWESSNANPASYTSSRRSSRSSSMSNSNSVASNSNPLISRMHPPPSPSDLSRRVFLTNLRKRYPSEELVKLEETLV